MRTVVVSGSGSRVGKTYMAEQLLRALKNWSALKVTTIKEGPCPREIPCGTCENQKKPFTIISDAKTINQKGKDTARMKKAGAKTVLWLKAKPQGLKEGIRTALEKLRNAKGVIIEGTSVLKFVKPDINIHIDKMLSARHCEARSAEAISFF